MATQEELRAELKAQHDKEIIAKAIKALEVRGCKYRVIEVDGSEHANFEERPQKKVVNKFVQDTNYIEIISKIEPGGSEVVMVPADKISAPGYVENLRSSILGRCTRMWLTGFKVAIAEDKSHIKVTRDEEF